MKSIFFLLLFLTLVTFTFTRQHKYTIRDERRPVFALSTFGFTFPGFLFVNISNLQFSQAIDKTKVFGFTVDRADSAGISPYIEHREDEQCIFSESPEKLSRAKTDIIAITLNSKNMTFNISRYGKQVRALPFYKNLEDFYDMHASKFRTKVPQYMPPKLAFRSNPFLVENNSTVSTDESENPVETKPIDYESSTLSSIPIRLGKNEKNEDVYHLEFVIYISNESFVGLYSLFYHNCENIKTEQVDVSFDVEIVEKNGPNFLSAFEIHLPMIYLSFSTIFFSCGILWMMVLRKGETGSVYKIHYLMLLVVFVKSMSVLMHAIDYHFINITGHSHSTWYTELYYVANVIRGLLLFTVLILIGSGWQLMKHVFSNNEKRVFVLVLSLQVLTNLAFVLKENTEEGAERHEMWQQIFILVDLICCGTVLFPIVWSIRHLQEASRVDGKGSANLDKLKLFRQFYITIVCYIYFTRIVVYLLRILVYFQYRWLDAVCTEGATLFFFVFTAYTFRPNANNPYMRLTQLEDEDNDYSDDGFTSDISLREVTSLGGGAGTGNSTEHGSEANDNPDNDGKAITRNGVTGEGMRRVAASNKRAQMQKSVV